MTKEIGFDVIDPGDGTATYDYTLWNNDSKPKYIFSN